MGSKRHATQDKLSVELIEKPDPQIMEKLLEVEASAHIDPWTYDALEASFTDNTRCLGLYLNRELIGFSIICFVVDESELYTIGIKRQYQGLGYGHKLMKATMRRCIEEGAATCYLEVRVSNEVAKHLYDTYGFTTTGRRKNYYSATSDHPAEDAYTMACDLTQFEDGFLEDDYKPEPLKENVRFCP